MTTLTENAKIETFNDVCPVHNTPLYREYEFGNRMHPAMIVSTFKGCRCACSHRELTGTRYHVSYENARNTAVMQKQLDRGM